MQIKRVKNHPLFLPCYPYFRLLACRHYHLQAARVWEVNSPQVLVPGTVQPFPPLALKPLVCVQPLAAALAVAAD